MIGERIRVGCGVGSGYHGVADSVWRGIGTAGLHHFLDRDAGRAAAAAAGRAATSRISAALPADELVAVSEKLLARSC